MHVLVINAGSSSIKYQFFDMDTVRVIAKGLIERIGEPEGRAVREIDGRKTQRTKPIPSHSHAFKEIVADLTEGDSPVIASLDQIDAVGHRVVHGAEFFTGSVVITQAVLDAIRQCVPLAPLHNPPNLTGIEAAQELLPDVPHVAVFDTAFHQAMPKTAFLYAIPYELYSQDHIRRYGFHGTSHLYVSRRAAEMMGKPVESFRCITVHLGNGCSVAAVRGGHSVDTSMGLTPLEGLVMGTRSGDIDPAIVFHLADVKGMSFQQINNMLNKKSGLLGLSGVSNDMRSLREAAAAGNEQAKVAIDVFAYRVRKYVGAYLAVLGGADAIIFTGGIGENNGSIRAAAVDGMEELGIKLNSELNARTRSEADVSASDSRIRVLVVPTNEELVIARDTAELAAKK